MNDHVPIVLQVDLADLPLAEATEKFDKGNSRTPVQTVAAEAHANSYDAVCIPLTNHSWRARWKSMCETSGDDIDPRNSAEVSKKAELWRAGPSFTHNEVTMTRLGLYRFLRDLSIAE